MAVVRDVILRDLYGRFAGVAVDAHVAIVCDGVADDLVIVTHDHGDHKGDSFDICKRTGATLVSVHEVAVQAEEQGIPTEGMNIGGTVETSGVIVHMVQALHSSETGDPTGVVLELDGQKLYHAGDTGLTYDMKIIGEFFHPDLSFIPIGDRYTTGIGSATKAVEFVQTKKVIPIHYGTFPIVSADPEEFKRLAISLFPLALEGLQNGLSKGDTQLIIFFFKNIAGFSEKKELDFLGKGIV